ncbi:axoneme-associated protein mst101(2)-like [Aricia agestis]|uniref:axoneme-associated protein mst101(2)-like n=1 Tax=Aricia agestis TaxID=91739 RepID=UPI001C204C2C|nr:axoneme-associated protein mst101(2)-like [Aricia agestis]
MSESNSQKRWVPKDGPGPRGGADCYYEHGMCVVECEAGVGVSWSLAAMWRACACVLRRATALYVLRARYSDPDRLSAQLAVYWFEDIAAVRASRRPVVRRSERELAAATRSSLAAGVAGRLKELYACEEQENIKKFVEQAQAGAAAAWQEKMDRLKYLQEKRRQEHEAKYKKLPLSNSVQLLATINKLRAKETQEVQLYQIREKRAREMAESEFDNMWHEVAMKEAEALGARMEYDAIVKAQKDLECKNYTLQQIEMKRLQRERDKELLIEEAKRFKSIWESDLRKEDEEQQRQIEKRHVAAAENNKVLEQAMARKAEEAERKKLIDQTWDSLTQQQLVDDRGRMEFRRRRERDLVHCNKELVHLRRQYDDIERRVDDCIEEEARRLQEKVDRQRCQFRDRFIRNKEETRQGLLEQIRSREEARVRLKQKIAEDNERIQRENLSGQLQKLIQLQLITKTQAKKLYGQELVRQAEEVKLMKEQEKKDKSEFLLPEYTNDGPDAMKRMSKPFVSEVHPFKKILNAGVPKTERCPCSPADYC